MENGKKFLDAMESDIMGADIPDVEKNKLMKNFLHLKEQKINIMITGATGCGKSSTINALFDRPNLAKVGVDVDPETMDIKSYELDNLVLWDTPGLGDGKEADNRHAKEIIRKLNERDENGQLLIDLVLVILDGTTRDLGTSYELINQVIIPNLGEDKENRILVAINQADRAMKGPRSYWDYEKNKPEQRLIEFLEKKVISVRDRIKEGTGIDTTPIYYSAGWTDGIEKQRPYNLSKLLYYIIKFTPKEKRLSFVDNINRDEEMWQDDDGLKDYRKGILGEFGETVTDCALEGADIGGQIGSIFGSACEVIGNVVGGAIGAGVGVVTGILEGLGGLFSGCYVTTAICEEYGKLDDCYELTALRCFRDEWLKQQPDGHKLIAHYYATAPAIVSLIDKQEDRTEIYHQLNKDYLSKCISYIEANENEKCKDTYLAMMDYLQKEQEKWQ